MKFYNSKSHDFLIGHFPGETRYKYDQLINEFKNIKFKNNTDVTIISPITKNFLSSSPLHYQLVLNEYKYINTLYDRYMKWEKISKIDAIIDSLMMCKTKYSLILDGNDVVILDDLTDIINRFDEYNVKILFNPTIYMFPHVVIDKVPNREKLGKYCYLNAGCCIGETYALLKFYQDVKKEIKKDYIKVESEQYYVRKVFDKNQDTVFFDYKCNIFQCFHKTEIMSINGDWYIKD